MFGCPGGREIGWPGARVIGWSGASLSGRLRDQIPSWLGDPVAGRPGRSQSGGLFNLAIWRAAQSGDVTTHHNLASHAIWSIG